MMSAGLPVDMYGWACGLAITYSEIRLGTHPQTFASRHDFRIDACVRACKESSLYPDAKHNHNSNPQPQPTPGSKQNSFANQVLN